MSHEIESNAKLFDALLQALNKHQNEKGVLNVFECLNAAKCNYVQRDVDHMVSNLVLALDQLTKRPLSPGLRGDLRSVIRRFVEYISETGPRMRKLAEEYEASGGKLLSRDEILGELNDRRRASR